MKIEKINENKIKVTLSNHDLAEHNLDFQSLRYNSPEAQTLFWDMIKKAESEHGFKASNCQLFIEAASIMDGDCTVTITKMTDVVPPRANIVKSKNTLPATLKVRKKHELNSTSCIIAFKTFDALCEAISANTLPLNLPSSVYEYKNNYYLLVKPSISKINSLAKLILILGEFGEIVYDPLYTEGVLMEYGNKIIDKNALTKLNK